MNRESKIKCLEQKVWDIAIIGGGASGLGVALDALSRGLSVLLVEKSDFAKGTSSRSTKLLHGGVRYLAHGQIKIVMDALKERSIILKNAPHVSRKQTFIIPIYTFYDLIKYNTGLKVYDMLAGKYSIGSSKFISKARVMRSLPTINSKGLIGGVVYYDGQFDDARLALNIAQTCDDMGGNILNYMKVISLGKNENGHINGFLIQDMISKRKYHILAHTVVNATGVFADKVLKMDNIKSKKTLKPSQGSHIVLDRAFLASDDALMIPKTADGRVLFAIPWHEKVILGTTDILRKTPKNEPVPLAREIDFILETFGTFMVKKPHKSDILSSYAGMRPLAAPAEERSKTQDISRSHKITVSKSGLVSIIGGKWTTFRKMGEDAVDAIVNKYTIKIPQSSSSMVKIHGYKDGVASGHLSIYGSDADHIIKLWVDQPDLNQPLHPDYPYTRAEVIWAVRNEMALKVDDVLARRFRMLFLDAKAATEMVSMVAELMAKELVRDEVWIQAEIHRFKKLAKKYMI
ncbi:glycerol-3-phosphate dehydrogenase/oxidase [Anditalea andensis]|uniref:FAD-dependent oxidoreductase n=1 Tax=Anditalea andensis TaxID=1048983 RepID=A0A074L4C6_9BACT|nr:glycerol-3-phosphate dehydrogenase/oxidase [Anditalea andensis]KEO74693.1 FAD-dependent oxidoreductase [Anditalea andensis]